MDREAPAEIVKLVEHFERNIDAYKNQAYKEANLRQEFLDPFFEALGWDVRNKRGAAPQYRLSLIHISEPTRPY